MSFRLVQELAADGVRVAVACRMLRVSSSGYYEQRGRPPSLRAVADEALTTQIKEIHVFSRGAYELPSQVDRMPLPGALISTQSPKFEKGDLLSSGSVAATVITPS